MMPWELAESRLRNGSICAVYDEDGDHVASIYGRNPDQREARMRLIAAAPDMLNTLKAVGRVLGERPDDDELFAAFSHVINTIMKAEGGQS